MFPKARPSTGSGRSGLQGSQSVGGLEAGGLSQNGFTSFLASLSLSLHFSSPPKQDRLANDALEQPVRDDQTAFFCVVSLLAMVSMVTVKLSASPLGF